MKAFLTLFLLAGTALAQSTGTDQTPAPPPQTAPAPQPAEQPKTEQPTSEQPKTTPAAPVTPATPTEPEFPIVKVQVTVPEALQGQFQEALKVFSHERVPFQAEFVQNADQRFLTETDIPFNPDAGSRTLTSGNRRWIWINTSTTLSQSVIWRVETAKVLKLSDGVLLPKERTLTESDKQTLKTLYASKGDFNSDDRVDLLDLIILASNMGVENPSKGDLNQDGQVNEQDYNLFRDLYQK